MFGDSVHLPEGKEGKGLVFGVFLALASRFNGMRLSMERRRRWPRSPLALVFLGSIRSVAFVPPGWCGSNDAGTSGAAPTCSTRLAETRRTTPAETLLPSKRHRARNMCHLHVFLVLFAHLREPVCAVN